MPHRPYYRIVNLVIYNESVSYERLMRRELERLMGRLRDVKTLFVSLRPDCTSVHEEGGTLSVPGHETFIPGILHKTIEAIHYCVREVRFDFVVRSNISTVIDFGRLTGMLPRESGAVYASTWIWGSHVPSGAFASGTNIILNDEAARYILKMRHEINMDVIDDVSIGNLLRRVTIPRQLQPMMTWNADTPDGVVFRNRSDDRLVDVTRMRQIIDRITGQALADQTTMHTMTMRIIIVLCLTSAAMTILFVCWIYMRRLRAY